MKKFLGDENLAEEYSDGSMFILRLTPPDYHRFHSPFDCAIKGSKKIKGIYESVNPIVYALGLNPLESNERQILFLDSKKFGEVLFITVGAMMVGKIKFTYDSRCQLCKGNEMGYFEFGGSTVVLLFKRNTVTIPENFVTNSAEGYETQVKVGQVIGTSISQDA